MIPFLPAVRGQFQWDDEELHIQPAAATANPLSFFVPGSSATHVEANYYPLSMLAFWCEYRLFGTDTTGYHAVNLLFHAANVLLAWLLLRRLRAPWPALVALIFALHPMMTESVAYISEIKNLLSGFFCLTTAHLWFSWTESSGKPRPVLYVGILLCFLAAMLAKSTACVMPIALLLLERCREGSLRRRELAGVTPLFVIAALVGALFIHIEQTQVGASGAGFHFSPLDRLLIAGHAVWFYVGRFLCPWPLLTVYRRWHINPGAAWQYLFPLAAVAVLLALWFLRKRLGLRPLLAVLLFLLLLSPSVGFVTYYPMLFTFVADHYFYLALLPLAALFVGMLQCLTRRLAQRKVEIALACLFTVVLAPLTFAQAARWRTDITLWEPTVAGNPDSWYATANLAYAYVQAGRYQDARQLAERSLRLREDNSRAHFTLGLALLRLGDPAGAADTYARGLSLESGNAVAWFDDGLALEQLGNLSAAAHAYAQAASLNPHEAKAWNNLAVLQLRQSLWQDAAASARAAIRAAPDYGNAYVNLGIALEKAGETREAIDSLRHGLSLLPPTPRVRLELIRLLLQQDRFDDAADQCHTLIKESPQSSEAIEAAGFLERLKPASTSPTGR